jgi:hypothetical protein
VRNLKNAQLWIVLAALLGLLTRLLQALVYLGSREGHCPPLYAAGWALWHGLRLALPARYGGVTLRAMRAKVIGCL